MSTPGGYGGEGPGGDRRRRASPGVRTRMRWLDQIRSVRTLHIGGFGYEDRRARGKGTGHS